jgi:hypothetical protein
MEPPNRCPTGAQVPDWANGDLRLLQKVNFERIVQSLQSRLGGTARPMEHLQKASVLRTQDQEVPCRNRPWVPEHVWRASW